MNEGRIIEQGTHEALIEKGGFYKKLYSAQRVTTR
jgi:ABC-type multidrug transport system fused ATPase/permease subunit